MAAGVLGGSVLMGLGTAQAHGVDIPVCNEKASDGHCGQKSETKYKTNDGKVHVVVSRDGCAIKGNSTVDCSVHHP
ncbi:hypothetical protein ACWDTR_14405 [Streptomyces sp. NPDC003470]